MDKVALQAGSDLDRAARSAALMMLLLVGSMWGLTFSFAKAASEAGLPLLPGLLHPDRWLLWLGLLFIASVYFFPTGVVGRLRNGRGEKSTGASH